MQRWNELTPHKTPTLSIAQPTAEAFVSCFGATLKCAHAQSQRPPAESSEAVHQWRKSLRFARALLKLTRSTLSDEDYAQLATPLKQLAHETSSLRDADVLLEAIAALPADIVDTTSARERFLFKARQLREDRDDQEVMLLLQSMAPILPELYTQSQRAFAHLERNELRAGLKRVYRNAQRARDAARRTKEPDELHDFRKRCKELRHSLEILPNPEALPLARAFARLTKELGEITDLTVVCTFSSLLLRGEVIEERSLKDTLLTQHREMTDEILRECHDMFELHPNELVQLAMPGEGALARQFSALHGSPAMPQWLER